MVQTGDSVPLVQKGHVAQRRPKSSVKTATGLAPGAIKGDSAELQARLNKAYSNQSGWTQIKLVFLVVLLLVAVYFCYEKQTALEADLKKSWDAWDALCHENPDPSDECAHHLIHIRTDEDAISQFQTATYGAAALALVGTLLLLTQSAQQLNSKLL
eukprot:Rhum_TRINITY_DN24890_c0_g1::Rhum_TRINITY_DN24890_c0_g1_i1::g.180164::m.180164